MRVNVGDKVLVQRSDFNIYSGTLVGEVIATSPYEREVLVGFKNYHGHSGNGATISECNSKLLDKYRNMCWWVFYEDILEIR